VLNCIPAQIHVGFNFILDILWIFNDDELLQSQQNSPTFTIDRVNISLEGDYTCTTIGWIGEEIALRQVTRTLIVVEGLFTNNMFKSHHKLCACFDVICTKV